ncbi:MAG TPA: triose-phosphate isomerase [Anaerolineae bacterium]|nr:triose-phosphate isomerase [Anaerolineae bacterium]
MRIPIIAGNWKMHKTIPEAVALVAALKAPLAEIEGVDKVVCPTAVCLSAVRAAIGDAPIGLGAQNVHFEEEGAYTGEIAPRMLEGLCEYVIIGHSERRGYFDETDEMVNSKIKAALAHHLTPIVCVGETLQLRKAGQTHSWVGKQVVAALEGLSASQVAGIVLAYEPIWAIGTGVSATSEDAQEVIGGVIRPLIAKLYDVQTSEAIRIQYGGSVKPDNAAELMTMPDVDGGLVGGASLNAGDFAEVVRLTARSRA